MSAELEGQVALVTGASRGIGRAIACRLGGAGARVLVNFVQDEGSAEETVRRIRAAGGSADSVRFDVADSDAVSREVDSLCRREGRLDILVNNAGITADGLIVRMKPEQWEKVMAIDLKGVFNCTRVALRAMLRARYGRVVNLRSVTGLMGNAGQAAYAAAKAGVIGFTKATAREVGGRGITANAVAPGLIETDMAAHLPGARRSEYLSVIPVGRLGTAEEVAELVGFLVRRDSGYITGQVIGINGGLYM